MTKPSSRPRPCRPRRALLASSAALAASLLSGAAAAQDAATDGEFSVQRFNPAPGPGNFFTTRGARTDGEMAFSGGGFVNYAYKPFVVRSCRSESDCDAPNAIQESDIPVVENLFTLDLMAAVTIFPRLQVGLRLPVTMTTGQGLDDRGFADPDGLSGTGLGDAELEGKFRAYGEPDSPVVVGAALFVTGPLGKATAEGGYLGDETPTVGARGIFDGREGPFSFGANLAALYRGEGRVGSTTLGPEFRYGVAGGYQVSPVLRVVLDGFGATKFSAANGTNSLEIDAGVQIRPLQSRFVLSVGAGAGVIEGVGVPLVRGFGGLAFAAGTADRDGDGVSDDADQCPTEKEDVDGFEDADGCPELDNDGDTIGDAADKCRDKPEDPDGFEDADGCPELDNDKDAIPDDNDQCPDAAETKNGFKDNDGCPDEADADGDGVPDAKDKCKDEPEDTDGFEDTDGCPDPDNDKDGIPDNGDECIDEPETKNDFEDTDGCPDEAPKAAKKGAEPPPPPKLVEVTAEKIVILDKVEFETNSPKIKGKRSFQVLDAVAAALIANPQIVEIEIGGHTDDRGDAAKNKALSQKRAEAVLDYLVKKRKIAAERLKAAGYGQEKPIADNKTADGRQKNRRVEFNVTKQK
ncbi:MAG: OmpA family protein [Polyangiaceae bacterium]|nr:OmpA family protein [Polyangiaceae bacterium]